MEADERIHHPEEHRGDQAQDDDIIKDHSNEVRGGGVNSGRPFPHENLAIVMPYRQRANGHHRQVPQDEKQAKKNINMAVKKAASQLHHTANVSKKSYMDNEIITLYVENPMKFKRLVESHRKRNGNLPTISRLLNLVIMSIKI